MTTQTKTMRLVTSDWNQKETFKMMPVSTDCPYNECIFDPLTRILAIISKEKKQSFQYVPKLDVNGDVERLKVAARPNGKQYREERKLLEGYYEYYLEKKEEIMEFIKETCINADSYDFSKYLDAPMESLMVPEKPGLITELGTIGQA